ncbi:MAG: PAS domain S-box protein [Candidatus Thiodiazotropha sp.]
MKKRSDKDIDEAKWEHERERIIGLGQRSLHKTYFPAFQQNLGSLHILQQAVDQAASGILIGDSQGRVAFVNSAWSRLTGQERESLVGKSLADYWPQDTPPLEHILQGLASENAWQGNLCFASGKTNLWMHANVSRVEDGSDDENHFIVVIDDITLRKNTEYEFRSLAEASPDNIIRYDRQMRIRYVNQHLLDLFGHDFAEKLLGRRPDEIESDSRLPMAEEAVQRVLESGREEAFELAIPQPDGEPLYHHLSVVPERDANGEIVGVILFGRDLTQYRRTEIELEKSNARLQTLFDSSPDPVWIIDQNQFVDCNQAAVEMLGYPDKTQLLNIHPSMLSPPVQPPDGEDSFAKAERMMHIATEQGLHRFEWIHRKADGTDFTAEVTLSQIDLDDHLVMYCTWRDISDRKQMEKRLAQREEQFRTLAESAPDNIARHDCEGRILYVNPMLERTVGMPLKQLRGKTFLEVMPSEPHRAYGDTIRQVAVSKESATIELPLPGNDGEVQTYMIRLAPELGRDGEVVAVVAIGRDITERKVLLSRLELLESTLNSSGDEIHILDSETLRFEYANEVICHNLGYSSEELRGMTPADIDPDFTIARLRDLMEELKGSGSKTFETRHRHRDGTIYPVEINIVMVNHRGHDYALAIARDITERKALRSRLELLETAVIRSADAIHLIDEESLKLEYVNDAFCKQVGYEREELADMTPADLDPDVSYEQLREMMQHVQAGEQMVIQSRHRHKDGHTINVEISTAKVTYAGRCYALAIARDITERKRMESDLQDTKNRLAAVVNTIPDLIWMKDRDGVFLTCNPAIERLFDAPENEIVGKTDYEFMPQKLADLFREKDREVMASGQVDINEEEVISQADGHRIQLETRKVPVVGADGEVLGVLGIGRDITEQKEAEAALKRSEARFRLLYESTPAMMHAVDTDANIIYVSDAWLDKLGYTRNQVIGKNFLSFLTEQHRRYAQETVLPAFFESGHCEDIAHEFVTSDGRILDMLLSAIAEYDSHGKVVRAYAVLQDVTQRNRDQRRIEELVLQQQAILDNELVGISILKERRFVWVNPALEQMLGYPSGELAGQATREIYFSDQTYRSLGEDAYPVIGSGQVYRSQREFRRRNGTAVWLDISGSLLNEETSESLWAFVDISGLHQAQLELLAAKDAAEAATRAKSDFLASMSHEIRTPMNAILGMLYLALKSDMPPTLHGQLRKAEGAAKSLLGIINDILDFSKIEAGKLAVERIEFDLEAVVQQLVDTVVMQAEAKGIECLIRFDVEIPKRLIGDPLRLGQILLNLCSNAIKFTEGGEVELALTHQMVSDSELTLQISVRDTGIGMSAGQQQKLFQKFSQADQSNTRRFGGTGLGLTISKHLAGLMDGDVWIERSVPGQGTTMGCTVRLGRVPQSEAYKANLLEHAGPLLDGLRVLVVDDNAVSRQILSDMLSTFRIEANAVADAATGLECLVQAKPAPYEVVLMDWLMPSMNGDEATRCIHADPRIRSQPKVVMVTAHGREEVIQSAEAAGVDGFLSKPVSPSMLLDALMSALGRGQLLHTACGKRSDVGADNAASYMGTHLLLVEDNAINRDFAEELLHSLGIELDTAVNGLEAVEMAQQSAYDAILMDVQMPKLDGLEATRRIRALSKAQNDRFARVPIIAMTALAMSGDRAKSLAAGMNDHVTKPIDPERLKAVLGQWVEVPEARRKIAVATAEQPAETTKGDTEDLLALKHLDAAQGIHRIGGKPDAYRKQLWRFRDHYADAAQTLQKLVATEGVMAGEAYCHALKGVSGSIGADALAACVTELDELLKQGVQPGTERIEEVKRLLTQVIQEINGLTAPITAKERSLIDPAALPGKVMELAHLLKHDLGAAELLLEQLRTGLIGTELGNSLDEIAAKMEMFEIDEALSLVDVLRSQLEAEPQTERPRE